MRDTLTTFVIVSFAYIISYSLTSGFVYPIQTTLLPGVSEKTGLLFLSHGVRIIAGVIGSLLNGIGLTALQHEVEFAWNVLGYVIGDVAGLFASLLILMYVLKFLRHYRDI